MSLHHDAQTVLATWPAPDAEQDRLRVLYLQHLAAHDDALLRSCSPDHLTASALVVSADHARVLLTLHATLGRWLQTGGHCEADDVTLGAAALREATEESGIAGLRLDPVPVLLSRHEVPCGPEWPAHHLDVQFLAVAPADAQEVVSEESTELGWFGHDGLDDVTDRSVRLLIDAASSRLRGTPSP